MGTTSKPPSMHYHQIPVLLLTGYLGSGKTTLVNRILTNTEGIRFAVIVNDIGEVNIDASLIEKGGIVGKKDDSLVPLQNGCICCTLKMDLLEQLRDITSQHRFDYIVIEASGICEPAPIAQTICSIPSLGREWTQDGVATIDAIVTVVDALRLQSEFRCGDDLQRPHIDDEDLENLVIQQIEFCNVILLNKAAEVSPHELGRIRTILRSLQPHAEIIECNYCNVPFDKLLHTHLFDFNKVASSAAWVEAIEGHQEDPDGIGDSFDFHDDDLDGDLDGHLDGDLDDLTAHHHHDDGDDEEEDGEGHHHHHHHHHDHEGGEVEEYGIGTYVYYRRQAFDTLRFEQFIQQQWPRNIIRAKGMCYLSDNPDMCYLFEQSGVQKQLSEAGLWYATMPQDELTRFLANNPDVLRDWDPTLGDRMNKIVFIGQHLDAQALAEQLDDCLI